MDDTIKKHLGLKHGLVGVKIFKNGDAAGEGRRPNKKMRFCQMVWNVSEGKGPLMFGIDDLDCPDAMVSLGFQEPTFIKVETRIDPADTKLIEVAPAKDMENPDIVLAILNPRQLMDLAMLLGGIEAKFEGNRAVCGEATAVPYMNKKPNISPLCGGSRKFAKYTECELIFGAPPETMEKLEEKIKALPVKDKVASSVKRFFGR